MASMKGQSDVVTLILKAEDVQVNIKDEYEQTALIYASQRVERGDDPKDNEIVQIITSLDTKSSA